MSVLKQLSTKISRFIIALEDARDPMDEYILTVGKRVEKLERDMSRLETELHSNLGGSGLKQTP